MRKMKKSGNWFTRIKFRTWVILVVLIAAIAFGIRYYINRKNSSNIDQYQTVEAVKGELVATIGATGTVRSYQTSMLIWQTTGTIGSINVAPGDKVNAGDVLASLEKTSLPQTIIMAQADLVNAQNALDNLKVSTSSTAQAELNLVTAQKNYYSAKATLDNLKAKNKGSTSEAVQNAQAQVTLAQNRLNGAQTYFDYVKNLGQDDPNYAAAYTALYNAQQALKSAQNNLNYYLLVPSGRDIAEASAKVDVAKAQLDDAQRQWDKLKDGPAASDIAAAQARVDAATATLNMARLTAPFSGTVTEVNGLIGDQVSPATQAIRIDDLSHMQMDVQVSEVDINSVQVGQSVALTFDAISGKNYEGKVVQVAQAGEDVLGAVKFTVTVELTDADTSVKPGMTAAVNITVQQLNDVLLVPNRAVRLVDNQRVIYVLADGQAKQVKVNLGASSDTMSEVVSSDLKAGDLIILNPPSTLFQNNNGGGPFGGGM
jgi:HlyD family secretion protein